MLQLQYVGIKEGNESCKKKTTICKPKHNSILSHTFQNKIPRQKSQAFLVISTKPIIVVNTYTEEEPKEILKNLIKSNGELRRL